MVVLPGHIGPAISKFYTIRKRLAPPVARPAQHRLNRARLKERLRSVEPDLRESRPRRPFIHLTPIEPAFARTSAGRGHPGTYASARGRVQCRGGESGAIDLGQAGSV